MTVTTNKHVKQYFLIEGGAGYANKDLSLSLPIQDPPLLIDGGILVLDN